MEASFEKLFSFVETKAGLVAATHQPNFSGGLFGGQLMGQALAAAVHTAPKSQTPYSFHAYFVRRGRTTAPVTYQVVALRDGANSSLWRVEAIQDDAVVFHMACAFAIEKDTEFAHEAAPPPNVPPPEACIDATEFVNANAHRLPEAMVRSYGAKFPIERRLISAEEMFFNRTATPTRNYWLRVPAAKAVEDDKLRRCLIGYLSDAWLSRVAMAMHVPIANPDWPAMASLDHALWIHRSAPVDDWVLYAAESPQAESLRGLGRGALFTRDGRLIATAAQEGLLVRRAK